MVERDLWLWSDRCCCGHWKVKVLCEPRPRERERRNQQWWKAVSEFSATVDARRHFTLKFNFRQLRPREGVVRPNARTGSCGENYNMQQIMVRVQSVFQFGPSYVTVTTKSTKTRTGTLVAFAFVGIAFDDSFPATMQWFNRITYSRDAFLAWIYLYYSPVERTSCSGSGGSLRTFIVYYSPKCPPPMLVRMLTHGRLR
jgi:hypothetical protein